MVGSKWHYAVAATVALLFLFLSPSTCVAAQNLLLNSDLSKGSENSPDAWRTEAWISSPDTTQYRWIRNGEGGAELEVYNLKPNDARWVQTLTLPAGWYYFSAEVRTEKVGGNIGANISVTEDGIISPDVRADSGWRKVGFWLKVGRHGAELIVALRLGGFSSLNTGRAFFRNPAVVSVAAPSPADTPAFDLAGVRKASASPPLGSPWDLAATFAVLAGIAVLGWYLFTVAEPR
jgi:dolichyl-phosphate-mannose-protein mannosyltransferase